MWGLHVSLSKISRHPVREDMLLKNQGDPVHDEEFCDTIKTTIFLKRWMQFMHICLLNIFVSDDKNAQIWIQLLEKLSCLIS
jgi:hypothetical protein